MSSPDCELQGWHPFRGTFAHVLLTGSLGSKKRKVRPCKDASLDAEFIVHLAFRGSVPRSQKVGFSCRDFAEVGHWQSAVKSLVRCAPSPEVAQGSSLIEGMLCPKNAASTLQEPDRSPARRGRVKPIETRGEWRRGCPGRLFVCSKQIFPNVVPGGKWPIGVPIQASDLTARAG